MIMIIIASNWPQGQLGNPEVLGRLLDYLLIRLITVFDPDFFRVFFFGFALFSFFLLLSQVYIRCSVFRLMKRVRVAMPRIIAKRIAGGPPQSALSIFLREENR
jgi:hypothetical protein